MKHTKMATTEDYNFYDLGYNKNLTKTDKLITDAVRTQQAWTVQLVLFLSVVAN